MPPSLAERLLDHLRSRQEEMIELLRDLVAVESPTRVPASQAGVFSRLAAALAAAGFRSRVLPGRTSGGQLWAVPRRRPRPAGMQLLLGHSDTVWPLGTLASMPVELRDGRLTGPGVFDMKGGWTQGVFALRALHDLGLEPPLAPAVFVNSDEEMGSPESAARIDRLARWLARRAGRVFVLEPSAPGGRLKTGRKGIGQFIVTVRGRPAHAGLEPEKGASAILELARVIQRLHALTDPARGITVNVGIVAGGTNRNVVAAEARGEVDLRVLRESDAEEMERVIRGLRPETPGTTLEIAGGMIKPPLEPTPRNRALWQAAERHAGELGIALGEATVGGASDGNITSRHAPTLDGLGAVGDGAHAAHEYVEVARLPERAALLALLLMEPTGGLQTRDGSQDEVCS